MAKPKVYLSASELSLAERSLYQRDLGPRYSPNVFPEDTESDSKPKVNLSSSELSVAERSLYHAAYIREI